MSVPVLRGNIFYADLDPYVGCEQGGVRPVLVLQNNMGNLHSETTVVAAITCKHKPKLPTHVKLPDMDGLKAGSTVLLEQIRTIDKKRLRQIVGSLCHEQMRLVEGALSVSLGIKNVTGDLMVMTLCRSCVQTFRDSDGYLVMRTDFDQEIREACAMCNTRRGYDYKIIRKHTMR